MSKRGSGVNYKTDKALAKQLSLVDYSALNRSSLMNERKALKLNSASEVVGSLRLEGNITDPSTWSLLEVVK